MPESLSLFGDNEPQAKGAYRPLADRLRPRTWDDFQGLEQLDKNLIAQLRAGRGNPPSLVLWGAPGSGKTTFAKLVGNSYDSRFVEFSAVLGGVKEVREIVAAAQKSGQRTILFVDEIHRFNKGQQDAFLPHVERGTIILIGATTENPSFYLTSALLSRVKVLTLPGLSEAHLSRIAAGAAQELGIAFAPDAIDLLVSIAGRDARRLLNLIEGFDQAHPGGGAARRPPRARFRRKSCARFFAMPAASSTTGRVRSTIIPSLRSLKVSAVPTLTLPSFMPIG